MVRDQLDDPRYALFSHKPTDTPRVTTRHIDHIACLSHTDRASARLLHSAIGQLFVRIFSGSESSLQMLYKAQGPDSG